MSENPFPINKKPGLLSRFFKGAHSASGAIAPGAFLSAILTPAFVLDELGCIQKTNTLGEKLLIAAPEGRSLAARLGSSELLAFLKQVHDAEPGVVTEPEQILVRRAPAADLWFEASAARIPESAGTGRGALLVILRDVTNQRRLETVRRDFVANVSHDLRTPVTILKGYAETLFEDYDTLSDEERQRFVERLHRNAGRLHRLTEDLLQMSIAENDGTNLSLQTGGLHDIIREAADIFSNRLQDAGIILEAHLEADDTGVKIDGQKMLRILTNLFDNVIRHAKGATRIQISTTKTATGAVEILIADDGTGLAQADMEKMFDPFFRAEKSRTGDHGIGIGLSIVKTIMAQHGGTVSAKFNRPHGLAITLTI